MRLPALSSACLFAAGGAYAAFAPIPEIEKGQPLVIDLRGGVHHDSNIFGSDRGEQDSMVYTLSPQLRLNASLSGQTFARGRYTLDAQYYDDRPGEDTLYNHTLGADLFHSFSERGELTIYDNLAIIGSPESALTLGGVTETFQTDQSFVSNTAGANGSVDISERFSIEPAASYYCVSYDNDGLARVLDHSRQDASLGLAYLYSRTKRLVVETRYRGVEYDAGDALKGSDTLYGLAGFDFDVEDETSLRTRLGVESRDRNAGEDATRFHGELSLYHGYAENSWVRAGAKYSLNETDAVGNYLDSSGPSLFVSAQLDPTGADVFLFTMTFAHSMNTLNARPGSGVDDIDEGEFLFGVAAIWNVRQNWSVRATVDFQDTTSDDPQREQQRTRAGIAVNYTFGLFE